MGRPIEIDREQAFRAALALFWQRGYQGTSLRELLHATGMGKGSFYAAFGSKEALFRSALDWYHQWTLAAKREIAAEHQGLSALRAFLGATLIGVRAPKRRRGCLLVNSVVELAETEPALHRLAARYLRLLEHTCLEYLEQAAAAGELRPALTPATLAPLVATLIEGLRVDARLGTGPGALQQRVDALLELVTPDRTQPAPASASQRRGQTA
ncbi:MAG: TetR/AcrR family transcriptional regulator [Pseudomonadota bacterium]